MPYRKTPLVNNQIYHVFNRSVAKQPIFNNKREYDLFVKVLEYYIFNSPPGRFSHFLRLNQGEKNKLLEAQYTKNLVNMKLYAFCIMPNHFHLLVKQIAENGISNSVRLIQNSYARYLNIKTERCGSLFQTPFKAVRITSDEQFTHVARYIHLNPLTSHVINDFSSLKKYPWNSYLDYISDNPRRFISTNFLLHFFNSKNMFIKFTQDNTDYQRKLEEIKHLIIEK